MRVSKDRTGVILLPLPDGRMEQRAKWRMCRIVVVPLPDLCSRHKGINGSVSHVGHCEPGGWHPQCQPLRVSLCQAAYCFHTSLPCTTLPLPEIHASAFFSFFLSFFPFSQTPRT